MARDWTTPEAWTDAKAINTTRLLAISTQLTWLYEMMFAKEGSALTIASGVITVTGNESFFKVSGEGAAADDLVTINGGTEGDIIILAYDGEAITVKETDNIDSGDYGDLLVMDAVGNNVTFRHDGTNWVVQATSIYMGVGEETVYIPASAMLAQGGSEPDGLEKLDCGTICHWGIPFDPSTVEYLNFNLAMPKRYDAGSLYFKAYWTTKTGGAAGNVVWGLKVRISDSDDALGTNVGSGVGDVTDAWIADLDLHIAEWSSVVTPEGTITDENPLIEAQFRRTATSGSDTLAVDAYLLGVLVRWTSDQETDD